MIELIQEKAAEVAELMNERLGIRGKDLAAKLRHTGRMMPKRIKHDAAYLAEVAAQADSPKLYKLIDQKRADMAYQNCIEFLETIDVSDRRKGLVLEILASITLSIVAIAALVIAVLVWRGFL